MRHVGWLTPVERAKSDGVTGGQGVTSQVTYPAEGRPMVSANGSDPMDELKRWLNQKFTVLENRVAALENAAKIKPPPPAAPAPKATPQAATPAKPHRPMLFVSNKVEPKPDEDLYTLAPALTKIPCVVETEMNSDTGKDFVARIRGGVYDTKTGDKLMIPQGAAILGEYHGASLVFGNERLPTLSTKLAFPDGRSIDLGTMPVMNQAGVAGLVSRVDQHWWRLIGATLIMGALRGGQMAVYSVIDNADAAGAFAAGVASSTGQVGQQKLSRALDTRPTIIVEAGTLCNVILTKPLELPAYTAQP
jgi:type IV secretion system protein VirB10